MGTVNMRLGTAVYSEEMDYPPGQESPHLLIKEKGKGKNKEKHLEQDRNLSFLALLS